MQTPIRNYYMQTNGIKSIADTSHWWIAQPFKITNKISYISA